MAESFNGLYEWELIYPKGPWRSFDDVEFATLTHVDWFHNRRLHGEIEPGPCRLHDTSRVRSRPLSSNHLRRAGEDTNHRGSMKPGALHIATHARPGEQSDRLVSSHWRTHLQRVHPTGDNLWVNS